MDSEDGDSGEGRLVTLRSLVTLRGAVAGVLAGACAIGVGQLAAGITGASSSPVVAVGQLQIDFTPPWLKNFAINEFGSNDKTVLVGGILVVLALFAALIGMLAMRRLWFGMVGVLAFAVVGLTAAATRPTATFSSLLPTLFAVATAAVVLRLLVPRAFWTPDDPAPDRRRFLVASVTTVAVAGLAGVIGRGLTERSSVTKFRTALRLPKPTVTVPPLPAGVNLPVPGISSFVTPNSQFYRVDTAIVLPQVDPSSWQLHIHGMVEHELLLTFDDLIRRPLIEDYITLCCVSNPVAGPYVGNALWLGASLSALLREAGIKAGADQLYCTSVDGFTCGTPVATAMDGRDALLAVAMNGQPLPVAHGFPARMVIPGLYGYVSATKWVTDIEVTTFAANQAYWVPRGWSQQAPIKTESRIDVPTGTSPLTPGKVTQVAGVAWAQHKGVAAVEVRVDNGQWQEAKLAAVPGIDTWRQWVYDWTPGAAGSHVIESRATDVTGYTQTSLQEPPEPNGASGYPMVQVTVN
ncbi:MAG TPA: molybdopterin-dependent oxidoreductase [Streptosporangiaceae bacterium]